MNELIKSHQAIADNIQSERRAFGIHPAILLTLMKEQGGSISRAFAELVMNSVDAGATKIDIALNEDRFVFSDDGQGFTSRDQIENFFEIFGTPHDAGDAYYGKFRIGRGQIMSYASTNWRSGFFEMKVDIAGNSSDLGYELNTLQEQAAGCRIEGKFYDETDLRSLFPSEYYSDSNDLDQLIKYVPIPVFVNGVQINHPPSLEKWDFEDDVAYYKFESNEYVGLNIYNRGVFVERRKASYFGISGHVVTKTPLVINLARNAIIEQSCPTWKTIRKTIQARFDLFLSKTKRLTPVESDKLLSDLLFGNYVLNWERIKQIRKIRFIPDIFGELQSPDSFLSSSNYTVFDGCHQMIAERVQRQKMASVLMPAMYSRLFKGTNENYQKAINILRQKLEYRGETVLVPFDLYVQELSDTSEIIEDKDLSDEELLTLSCLRLINSDAAEVFVGDWKKTRRIVAGKSDKAEAWTDGASYIAINRNSLNYIKGFVAVKGCWRKQVSGGQAHLVALLAHEYAHNDSSTGNHAHDYGFYQRFHESMLKHEFGTLADTLQRKYIAGMSKVYINPSAPIRAHISQIMKHALKFKEREAKKAR